VSRSYWPHPLVTLRRTRHGQGPSHFHPRRVLRSEQMLCSARMIWSGPFPGMVRMINVMARSGASPPSHLLTTIRLTLFGTSAHEPRAGLWSYWTATPHSPFRAPLLLKRADTIGQDACRTLRLQGFQFACPFRAELRSCALGRTDTRMEPTPLNTCAVFKRGDTTQALPTGHSHFRSHTRPSHAFHNAEGHGA